MRHLLNTLFVTTEDAYAKLDGENVVILQGEKQIGRYPLHILEGIFLFSYKGASPALMGKCVKENINLALMTPRGKLLARVAGVSNGNVLLRRTQYRAADDPIPSCRIVIYFVFGKISNGKQVLNRARRDHGIRLDEEKFRCGEDKLTTLLEQVLEERTIDSLRGIEGAAAMIYFSLFDDMILRNKENFYYHGRSRRPPLDRVNDLQSFVYTLLGYHSTSELEMVGLDSYVGFLHRDRSGRTSLALDLMEELRPCMADRFVLTLINNQEVNEKDFRIQEDGAVFLSEDGRKKC